MRRKGAGEACDCGSRDIVKNAGKSLVLLPKAISLQPQIFHSLVDRAQAGG
jgi:hypothetical protein